MKLARLSGRVVFAGGDYERVMALEYRFENEQLN